MCSVKTAPHPCMKAQSAPQSRWSTARVFMVSETLSVQEAAATERMGIMPLAVVEDIESEEYEKKFQYCWSKSGPRLSNQFLSAAKPKPRNTR